MSDFCRDIIRLLAGHGIDFLVGGYDAFREHTGISRETKDFDLVTRPADVAVVIRLCQGAGFGADLVFHHWLAKSTMGKTLLILSSIPGTEFVPWMIIGLPGLLSA